MPRPRGLCPSAIGRSRDGGAAVEFALVVLALLTLVIMVIELSWQVATGAALDYGGREASRFAVTGSCSAPGITTPTNRSGVIKAVVSQATGNFLLAANLSVTSSAYNTFGNYQSTTSGTSGGGIGSNTVAYTLSYTQPYLTGLARSILGMSSFTHVITIVVQNEPFIATCP